MAAQPRHFVPAILIFLVFYHSSAATLPDSVLSAHGKTVQEMIPHGLDLADLSLPAEVIIEALFTQTDLLQDKIEQCEEKVRINLKSSDAAETDGLEVDDKEEDDDSNDDDDGEDTLDKKIAQLAVDAFNHHGEDDSDNLNHHGEAPEKDDASDKDVVNSVAGNKSEEANSTVSEQRDHIHNDQKDAGEVEYVVYEYEDVAEDQQNEEEQNGEDKSAQESKMSKEQNKDDKEQKDTGKDAGDGHNNDPKDLPHFAHKDPKSGNEKQGQENPSTNSPVVGRSKDFEAQMDSINSDAEEPQSPPQEVNITNTITNDNHSNETTPPSKISNSIAKQVLVQGEAVTQGHASVNNSTTPTTTAANSETTTLQGSQGLTTTSKVPEPRGSTAGRSPAPKAKPEQASDNHSEGVRNKRSLSLDQIVMTDMADSGMVRDIHKVTFGQGRIRRQASPQEDIKSWLLEHTSDEEDEGKEPSLDILNKMLKTVLHELHGENSQSLEMPQSQISSLSYPTLKKPGTGADNAFDSGKQTNKDLGDILKMADMAKMHDVTNMAEQSPARDAVLKTAMEFLNKHKTRQPETNTRDWIEVQRLLATSRLPKGVERIRRRRSLLGRGSSPERYVPLIDQLVERLNYLQHSVQVCHMLLPQEHLPANHTLA